MKKSLFELLEIIADYKIFGNEDTNDITITSLQNDSRKVTAGTLFFALPGVHVLGSSFIKSAIDNGAAAVIFDGDINSSNFTANIPLIKVSNARDALWRVSCYFFDNPSQKLITIGVTGTEGKSSTVSFIWQLLRLCNKKAGFISTVEYSLGEDKIPNPEHQTTPESFIVQEKLFAMVQNGCEYAVIESSSHGLSKRLMRLGGVDFDVAVFMNVTEEHLEFHKTFEQYRFDKANLFRSLNNSCNNNLNINETTCNTFNNNLNTNENKSGVYNDLQVNKSTIDKANNTPRTNKTEYKTFNDELPITKNKDTLYNKDLPINKDLNNTRAKVNIPFGVVNALDPSASYFVSATTAPCYGFTTDDKNTNCTLKALYPIKNITENDTLAFTLGDTPIATKLSGAFNAMNISAALITVSKLLNITFKELSKVTNNITAIKGRMTKIDCNQDFTVIVDYAHTPSSFMAIMPGIKKNCKGRVIALFGSGGERDRVKRPIQGEIAGKYCDIVILADEDPRGEDPIELLKEIAAGAQKSGKILNKDLFIIHDRPTAIKNAFNMAKSGDTVLLLGKSHENSIIYKDYTMPYDEIEVAKKLLKSL